MKRRQSSYQEENPENNILCIVAVFSVSFLIVDSRVEVYGSLRKLGHVIF